MRRTRRMGALIVALLITTGGCESELGDLSIRSGERVAAAVVLPTDAGPGLRGAAEDLAQAMQRITGAAEPGPVVAGSLDQARDRPFVAVTVDPALDLGEQGYRLRRLRYWNERGVGVVASHEIGAMYGLYHVAADLGVRYHHPEETFFPYDPGARLPYAYDDSINQPRFELRGFHEHTQHPTVMCDYLLRPEEPGFRERLSTYLRWLARNRQNLFTFQMLKSVNLDAWFPYIDDVATEARTLGVHFGPVVSFADQQQNGFKLLVEDSIDPERVQIEHGLDRFVDAGFDFVGLQIGSSEFTKPDDELTVERMNAAATYLAARGVMSYAWIHITCSVHDDQGGYFFHLPLRADAALGAAAHTTMFYTLEHPAPVYDCEDFTHQIDFMEQASGTRDMIFFPETAWWLGFDNNVPLVLPLTGWSREYDIEQVLPRFDVKGHLTFTSGREWTYWQYDHYLTRVTWDEGFRWFDYLEWIKPMYGRSGEEVVEVVRGWTALQEQHFYDENPLIYFYLAGELPQDEIGAAAGILARRPKLNFNELVRFDDARFAQWQTDDFDMLGRMRGEYQALLDRLHSWDDDKSSPDQALSWKLYRELYSGYLVYLRRIEHAIKLYAGVAAVRTWEQEKRAAAESDPPREPDAQLREGALAQAEARLAEARAISADVIEVFQAAEADYRYPIELLGRLKPESPTVYPYGYIEQTSTGYFWTRRDDQLAALIARSFQTAAEEWTEVPEFLFYTDRDQMDLTQPDSPLADQAITGFMPRLLFGLSDLDETAGRMTLVVAQDGNENWLPDPLSENAFDLESSGDGRFRATTEVYTIDVIDSTGSLMGQLSVIDATFDLLPQIESGAVTDLVEGSLSGMIASEALVEMVVSVGGIDAGGATELIKAVYDVPKRESLPAALPFAIAMTFLSDGT